MNFKANESKQKLRGGYYTPLDLAVFLTKWICEINPKNVLEPSCGDGIFFEALSRINGPSNIAATAFEIDKNEALRAKKRAERFKINTEVYPTDFLAWSIKKMISGDLPFDAVLGNPPFIRYQYLPEGFQENTEEIFNLLNLPFTKHTNAWVPFILASIALLKPGGRLAMVIPSEIIHIPYAQSLRTYLGKECHKIVIIDPQELWFEDTLQGAVLLLAEKKQEHQDTEGLGIYPVRNREFLDLDPYRIFSAPKSINGKTVEGKWTRALLDLETRTLLDKLSEHPRIFRFKDIADVDVGIVTGANNYFLINDEVVAKFRLSKWIYPMFGRSEHCPGVIYNEKQHQENIKNGKPTNFVWFKDKSAQNDPAAKAYISYGKKQNLHTRYKCRTRNLWYSVPSVYSTEIGMLKRAHDTPRLIFNKISAFTTDTAYRIKSRIKPERLVGSFINSLTALSTEIEGRHYGGGVLELVPSEIERLLIPLPHQVSTSVGDLDHSIALYGISHSRLFIVK